MSSSQKGFTLAEVLIALALLGVVAAFTIPKVLQSTGNSEAAAKIKEAVSTMESAYYSMKTNGSLVTGQNLGASFVGNTNSDAVQINTVSASATAAPTAGTGTEILTTGHPCISAPTTNSGAGYLQLPNGVVITGLNTGAAAQNLTTTGSAYTGGNYIFCIDINGRNGANTAGNDVFFGEFNPSGNFDGAGTVFVSGDNVKNFFWGDTAVTTAASGLYPATLAATKIAGTGAAATGAQTAFAMLVD